MKQLLLIRHAKSSWETSGENDFDRPLNDRGNRDAPSMAKRLLGKKISIDAFISSPAKRALRTASYFAEAFKRKPKEIITIPSLYLPAVKSFYEAIAEADNNWQTVAVFSHNPGITEFVNELTTVHVDNIPTCGIFAIKFNGSKWKSFEHAQKEFWFFDYPKLKE